MVQKVGNVVTKQPELESTLQLLFSQVHTQWNRDTQNSNNSLWKTSFKSCRRDNDYYTFHCDAWSKNVCVLAYMYVIGPNFCFSLPLLQANLPPPPSPGSSRASSVLSSPHSSTSSIGSRYILALLHIQVIESSCLWCCVLYTVTCSTIYVTFQSCIYTLL